MDILIVTYNRLEYLKRCISSIIYNTSVPYRIIVYDDQSTDGTPIWIERMVNRGLITSLTANKKGNTADNFNHLVEIANGDWFTMANDDMWFHRGWDVACKNTIKKYEDCGIVSFFNYTGIQRDRQKDKRAVIQLENCYKLWHTGLGAAMIHRPLFDAVGGFSLPKGKVMGFFASKFCIAARATKLKRNQLYMPYDNLGCYATNMDLPKHPYNERQQQENSGYAEMRRDQKGKHTR